MINYLISFLSISIKIDKFRQDMDSFIDSTTDQIETSIKLTLKESEIRFRRLFETAQDGILILDADTGMITDVNPYLMNMLGYSRKEFVKKKLWEVGAFTDIEASQDAFEALQENEYIRYEDLPLKAKDKPLFRWSSSAMSTWWETKK